MWGYVTLLAWRCRRRVGGLGLAFLLVQVAGQALLQYGVHVVGDGVEMRAGFGEALGMELEPREVEIDPLALDFVMGDGQGVGPGLEGLLEAQRLDPVVGLGDIGSEREVVGVELQRLAVELEGFVINLLLGERVELHGILAEQVHEVAEVLVIEGLLRFELDGFGVILERLLDRTGMAVKIGEVIVNGRVLGVQSQRLFPLLAARPPRRAGRSGSCHRRRGRGRGRDGV